MSADNNANDAILFGLIVGKGTLISGLSVTASVKTNIDLLAPLVAMLNSSAGVFRDSFLTRVGVSHAR